MTKRDRNSEQSPAGETSNPRVRWLVPIGQRSGAGVTGQSEAGIVLLEVLLTSVVVGIAALGLALMFSLGNSWVAAGGDKRVAMTLAQQKVEQLRSMTFYCIPWGGPELTSASGTRKPATSDPALPGPEREPFPCTAQQKYNEGPATVGTPCGSGCWWSTPAGDANAPQPTPVSRTYTRLTCVQYVLNNDFTRPTHTGSATTNSPCLPFVDTNTNLSCATVGGTCVKTRAKRIVVIVQPTRAIESEPPVVLRGWITDIAGGL